jgi:hypothetical protein
LREAWREGKKIRKRTIANLTHWPEEKIDALRHLLKGNRLVRESEVIVIERSVSCGHVRAILRIAEKTGLPAFISGDPALSRNIIIALVVEELLFQYAPNLAFGVWQTTSLADDLGIRGISDDDYLRALEWVCTQSRLIESGIESLSSDTSNHDQAQHIVIMLARHLAWHLQSALSPVLFSCEDRENRQPINRNDRLKNMFTDKEDSTIQGLLGHLATQCLNRCRISSVPGCPPYYLLTEPTPLQKRVHEFIEEYDKNFPLEPPAWASFLKPSPQRPGEKPFSPPAKPEFPITERPFFKDK